MHRWLIPLTCLSFGFASPENDLSTGYYWRAYVRDVPPDALPGGENERGKTTYIGQTVLSGCGSGDKLVLGQIREAEQQMTYAWGHEVHVAQRPIQVLCTQHPEHFKWISTDYIDIRNLTNEHLVSGGIQYDYHMYVGRGNVDAQIAIGKVVVSNKTIEGFDGMYTTVNNAYRHLIYFDVLAYDPTLKAQMSTAPKSANYSVYPAMLLIYMVIVRVFA